jgi:hypothetical protein
MIGQLTDSRATRWQKGDERTLAVSRRTFATPGPVSVGVSDDA